ncbi:MAG: metalloregulator ArsR/SmtB family transcription factor [Phycisphaeraceae bacterium]
MAKATSRRGASRRSLQQAVQVLRVIAHPLRVRLLERLERTQRPLSVTDLTHQLRQPQYAVSQHLTRMHLHGLLRRRQRGREVFYTIADEQIVDLLRWVRRYQQDDFWFEDGEAI